MSRVVRKVSARVAIACVCWSGLLAVVSARAGVVYQEYGGVVVGEGELYSSRTNAAAGDGQAKLIDVLRVLSDERRSRFLRLRARSATTASR